MTGNVNPADGNRYEGRDDQESGNQPQFLTNHRKNEIGVMLRNKAEFLTAIAQSYPADAPRAERDHGLIGLHPFIHFGFFQVQPRIDSFRAHRVLPKKESQPHCCEKDRREELSPADSSEE